MTMMGSNEEGPYKPVDGTEADPEGEVEQAQTDAENLEWILKCISTLKP
jgi:hypothetical protein